MKKLATLGLLALSFPAMAQSVSVSGGGLMSALIVLVIVGLIAWLVWWFIGYIGLPEPFNKVARVLIGLFVLIFLINLLLSLIGHPFIRW